MRGSQDLAPRRQAAYAKALWFMRDTPQFSKSGHIHDGIADYPIAERGIKIRAARQNSSVARGQQRHRFIQ